LKSIIITGASSGIGKAATIRLVRSGYQVFGLARKYEQLVNLFSELSFPKDSGDDSYIPKECDITKQENLRENDICPTRDKFSYNVRSLILMEI